MGCKAEVPQVGNDVILGHVSSVVGRDQACGQFVQYLEKPVILNMRRLDLGVEVGLCGVVNRC